MMSHYRNTISVVYLLFCLSVTSASASSVIRITTDDFNTNLQLEEGAGPIPNLDEPNYLGTYHGDGVSSRDHKVSASKTAKGLSNRAPSTYALKMESYITLLESNKEIYQTRPFSVGGYNWTLLVYPKGNNKDNGTGYVSLYVETHSTTPIPEGEEIYADLRFYVFNKKENQYFSIQHDDVWRFSASEKTWGFSQVIPVDTFKDPQNGYLYDGEHCEFGVDVTIPTLFEKSELVTITEEISNPTFTWAIPGYSQLDRSSYSSDRFTMANRDFYIVVYPNGVFVEQEVLSVFLSLEGPRISPDEFVLVEAAIRVLSQRPSNNVQVNISTFYSHGFSYGQTNFMPLADLRDPSKGFLVNDVLTVQVELFASSATEYLPN
ncbi:unnamed protein product [Thlaspi arvense]|uniref:MATH domain-containing protein n=1 Tax=Thlaspi arvense TaxID=13288 RepID=A0AAU9SIC6_THLAR|nr:unnamed protein product [Thlaspi arvense]